MITFFGAIFPIFFKEEIIELLRQIILQTENLDSFELTRFIMVNNIQSSFFAIFLGIFFGIAPLFITIINAYVLGFVINQSVAIEGPLIIWRLFPHGIFEIPAVLISVSLGLRLGMFLFFWKSEVEEVKGVEVGIWSEFKKWLMQSLRIFIFVVVPLLVIAGIIEGILIWAVA